MKTEVLAWCDQLLTATANGVGAGIFLVLFVGGGLRIFRGVNAATRHAVWIGALLLVAAVVPAQLSRQWLIPGRSPDLIPNTEPDRVETSPPLEIADLPAAWLAADGPDTSEPPPSGPNQYLTVPEVAMKAGQSEGGEAAVSRTAALSVHSLASNANDFGLEVPRWTGVGLVGVWIIVAGAKIALLLFRLYGVRQLKKSSLSADRQLNDVFQRVRSRLGVRRNVELRLSRGHRSALVLGFVHPVILFPVEEDDALDLGTAEQVMAHELAHIRRRDDWINLVQQSIQAILFFHPAVWWISRRLALEREIACDDFVLRQGGRPQTYALLLVNLAGRRLGDQRLLAPGVSAGKHQLQQRIAMILNANRNTSPHLAKGKLGCLTAAAALVAVAALYSGPRLVFAGEAVEAVPGIDAAAQPAAAPAPPTAPAVAFAPADGESPEDLAPEPAVEAPKFKPPAPVKLHAPIATVDVAPVPPAAPRRAAAAVASAAPQPPQAAPTPRPARTPRAAARDRSIEERLARLERMVESLVDQQKAQRGPGNLPAPEGGFGRMERQFKFYPDGPEFEAQFKREVERAVEQQKRAMKEAEKAVKEAEKAMKLDQKRLEEMPMQEMRMGLEKQLEALQQQREVLKREMEKVTRQIQKMQREHERTVEPKRRDSGKEEAEEADDEEEKSGR